MGGIDPEVERRLQRLEAESDARRRALVELMQELPAEVSRRQVLRDSVRDLRASADPARLVRRTIDAAIGVLRSVSDRLRARRVR